MGRERRRRHRERDQDDAQRRAHRSIHMGHTSGRARGPVEQKGQLGGSSKAPAAMATRPRRTSASPAWAWTDGGSARGERRRAPQRPPAAAERGDAHVRRRPRGTQDGLEAASRDGADRVHLAGRGAHRRVASARPPSRRSSSRRRSSNRRARAPPRSAGSPAPSRSRGSGASGSSRTRRDVCASNSSVPGGRDLGVLVDVAPADPPVAVGEALEIALRLGEDRCRDHDRRQQRHLPGRRVDVQDHAAGVRLRRGWPAVVERGDRVGAEHPGVVLPGGRRARPLRERRVAPADLPLDLAGRGIEVVQRPGAARGDQRSRRRRPARSS